MDRRFRLRRLPFVFLLLLVGIAGACQAIGCDSAELTTPQDCRGPGCTCEQDPSQPRCRGFSPGDEAGGPEGGATTDSPPIETDSATDAPADVKTDARDAGDAG